VHVRRLTKELGLWGTLQIASAMKLNNLITAGSFFLLHKNILCLFELLGFFRLCMYGPVHVNMLSRCALE
jgi:hypothetical protein